MKDAISIHEAFRRGDLTALQAAFEDSPDFPNCRGPSGLDSYLLEYAIYHGPLPLIRSLLELGADPNYADDGGFPSLIATLSCQDRPDRYDILDMLVGFGADIEQRGQNDYTPLHYACVLEDLQAIELLIAHGADLCARTRIDEYATPLEEAGLLGREQSVALLKRIAARTENNRDT